MKRSAFLFPLLFLLTVSLTGCDFVGDVIEFSLWTLLIIIVAVVLIGIALVKAFMD